MAQYLLRCTSHAEAVPAYEAAPALATNRAERELLTRRLDHARSYAAVED